ncbi:site-specific integrase [Winogradskyella luteola]|uniref:Site-specific integrase n=1 Tax=Winogradskyella luteola TaxID=2828330 RepID=A0A9X1JQS8_9FLAO|nr:site-specific integrase [Winogradskyella luteola]MBV7270144.1 site-specific integrase [Winogradskyella luteola]
MTTTVKLVLDARALSNGKHRIYLRLIKDRKRKNISLGLQAYKEHFENESFTKQHPNYQIENEVLLKFKSKALKIIREFQVSQSDFTLDEFEEVFRGNKRNQNLMVLDFFDELIDELKRAGKMGSAKAYHDTKNSLIKYTNKKFQFKDITPTFLEKYEVFLRETGSKNGGVAFRMRQLRAAFNKARKRNLVPKEPYPFESYKISKLKPESNKIALTLEEFKKFKNVDLSEHPNLLETYHFFMFSVYTRGMNFKDLMLLKWSDIRNNRIYYTRSKTKGRINMEVIPPAQEILDIYKAQNRATNYVFPILLEENLTPTQIANRKHKVLSRYNQNLKEIAKLAGIEKRLSSYVVRHSWATIHKMMGTSVEKISEMMGHSDVSITIAYLKEFSDEDLDEENRKFIDL